MSIRIKNQHGVIVNNVDGNQVIYGGQHGTVVTSEDARRAICDLRDALASAALGGATAARHVSMSRRSTQRCTRQSPTSAGRPGRSNGWSSCSPTPARWQRQAQP